MKDVFDKTEWKKITPIMDKRILDCGKCKLYGECDHQGSYKKGGKWCFE